MARRSVWFKPPIAPAVVFKITKIDKMVELRFIEKIIINILGIFCSEVRSRHDIHGRAAITFGSQK